MHFYVIYSINFDCPFNGTQVDNRNLIRIGVFSHINHFESFSMLNEKEMNNFKGDYFFVFLS